MRLQIEYNIIIFRIQIIRNVIFKNKTIFLSNIKNVLNNINNSAFQSFVNFSFGIAIEEITWYTFKEKQ